MPWLIYSTTYTYNWVDKVTVRVQCIVFLAQEHGAHLTMASPADLDHDKHMA